MHRGAFCSIELWNQVLKLVDLQIRAENLSGDCRAGREWRRMNFGFAKQHQVRGGSPERSQMWLTSCIPGVREETSNSLRRGEPELQVQG